MNDFLRIAVLDIDGPVANATSRFNQALEASNGVKNSEYWQKAFDPELVAQDQPVEGAFEYINKIRYLGWQIVFLSSRPDTLQEVTNSWLVKNGLAPATKFTLLLRPKWTKTKGWKANSLTELVNNRKPKNVIVVDDEKDNRDEMRGALELYYKYTSDWQIIFQVVETMKEALQSAWEIG